MTRFQFVLLAGALVIAGAAVVRWRARRGGGSPLSSLQQLADAARAHDRRAIEQYVDVRRLAESMMDEVMATAIDAAAVTSPDDRQDAWLGLTFAESMRPTVVALVEESIWAELIDSSASGQESPIRTMAGGPLDVRALTERYQGIVGVQQQGRGARVGVRVRWEGVDSAAVVQLRMERADAHWRVTGVENLAPSLQAGFERKRERAYEAAMRAYLRNLVTAQDGYFAAHATYASALGALTNFPTPEGGVSIAILEASGAGWRAVARHEKASSECRIAVGASVPRGDVEREPKCSGVPRR